MSLDPHEEPGTAAQFQAYSEGQDSRLSSFDFDILGNVPRIGSGADPNHISHFRDENGDINCRRYQIQPIIRLRFLFGQVNLLQGGALVQYVEGNITSADYRSPSIIYSLTNEYKLSKDILEGRSINTRSTAANTEARYSTNQFNRRDEQGIRSQCGSAQGDIRSSGCTGTQRLSHQDSPDQRSSSEAIASGNRPAKARKQQPIFANKPVIGLPILWDPKGKKNQPWETTYSSTEETEFLNTSVILTSGYREHDIRFSVSSTFYIRPFTEHFLRQGRDDIVEFIRERSPLFVFDLFQRQGKEDAIKRSQNSIFTDYERPEPLWHTRFLPAYETTIADRYLALFDVKDFPSSEPALQSELDYKNFYLSGILEIDPNDEHKFSRPLVTSRLGNDEPRDSISRGLRERAVGHAHSAPTYPGESIVTHNGQYHRVVPSIDFSNLRHAVDRLSISRADGQEMDAVRQNLNAEIDIILKQAERFYDTADRLAAETTNGVIFEPPKGERRSDARSNRLGMFANCLPRGSTLREGDRTPTFVRAIHTLHPFSDEAQQRAIYGRRVRPYDADWDRAHPHEPQPRGRLYTRYQSPDFSELSQLLATLRHVESLENRRAIIPYAECLLHKLRRQAKELCYHANQIAIDADLSYHFDEPIYGSSEPNPDAVNSILRRIATEHDEIVTGEDAERVLDGTYIRRRR